MTSGPDPLPPPFPPLPPLRPPQGPPPPPGVRAIPPLGPAGRGKPPPNVYQQAAQASLVAPFIAIILNTLTFSMRLQDPLAARAVAVGNIVLMLGGIALGVFALFGVRKHGRAGIVKPAAIGLTISLLLLAAALVLPFIIPPDEP